MSDTEKHTLLQEPDKHPLSVTPSAGIVRYGQGIAEIILRGLTALFAILAFLVASIAIGLIDDLDEDLREFIDDSDHIPEVLGAPDTPDLVKNSNADGGGLMALGIMVAFHEALVIALRCINVTFINKNIKIFLALDVTVSMVLACTFLLTGGLAGYYSSLWDKWVKFGKDNKIHIDVLKEDIDDGENIRGALGAACAFCGLEALALCSLAVCLLVSIVARRPLPPP